MDHFHKLQTQIIWRLSAILSGAILLSGMSGWAIAQLSNWSPLVALALGTVIGMVFSICLAIIIAPVFLEPVRLLWQAIIHVSGVSSPPVGAPQLEKIRLGRELMTSLVTNIYQLAREAPATNGAQPSDRERALQAANIVGHLPLPLFVCNKQQQVIQASGAAIEYCQLQSADLFGKPLFDVAQLEFPNDFTLEEWMNQAQAHKVTDQAYWERVRVRLPDNNNLLRQCDMAAYYNRDNSSGTEFIITLFDRTELYDRDDQALDFIAMAVHELRTPLTVLRGYIEVFEEELADKLDDELKDFMHKLQVSAEQLTGFVNNILNVARVQDNQLELQLSEENWATVLQQAVSDNNLLAQVHGKQISLEIVGELPPVALDRVSIYEVISNLLDNAIKYSGTSKEILITSRLHTDGTVVTTVQDFGVGIPSSVLPNIFEKFYRNHRTRQQIGGTGLGLYLCKAIIGAHGGQIWADSKEGQGSTFGFSLVPYEQVAAEGKAGGNQEITRAAHGWVKNHSFYRR